MILWMVWRRTSLFLFLLLLRSFRLLRTELELLPVPGGAWQGAGQGAGPAHVGGQKEEEEDDEEAGTLAWQEGRGRVTLPPPEGAALLSLTCR